MWVRHFFAVSRVSELPTLASLVLWLKDRGVLKNVEYFVFRKNPLKSRSAPT